MCLIRIGKEEAHIAKRDITVFKKVRQLEDGDFVSVHFAFRYSIGYHYTNNNFPLTTNSKHLTNEGMHSFSLKELKYYKKSKGLFNKEGHYVLIQCTIPKGTPYYRGNFREIISRELIVEKIITKHGYKKLLETL